MLKCQRVILGPARPSRYGRLRREPRRDGLSTIEAAAMLLAGLERRPDIAETLHASFERMLARYREVESMLPELAPKAEAEARLSPAQARLTGPSIRSTRTGSDHRAASPGLLGAASDDSLQSETQRSRSFKFCRICSSENPSAKKRSVTSPGTPRVRPSLRTAATSAA